MKPFTFGSLFSGIGGIDLGLERAGMQCSWQVEINEYATEVLKIQWPNVTRHGDVRGCGEHNLSSVDLVAGGFPCQDISQAGERAGIDGERSGLWREFARIVCELRPRYVIVENTTGMLEPIRRDGRIVAPAPISRVLGDLATLRYDAEYQVLSAAAFGAPHLRERVFIVAYPASLGQSQPRIFRQNTNPPTPLRSWPSTDALDAIRRGTVPALCRASHGLPRRMDRLEALGNAVVPQVAEYIAQCILMADTASKNKTERIA